jgi:hypothetical protein
VQWSFWEKIAIYYVSFFISDFNDNRLLAILFATLMSKKIAKRRVFLNTQTDECRACMTNRSIVASNFVLMQTSKRFTEEHGARNRENKWISETTSHGSRAFE